MFQSPLVRTLQLLNREEFEALHFFVASPIFNDVRPDETFQLFEYLRRHYPDFESEALNRELAARHFFPNSTNQIGALQRTMAQLMGIVKKFITFRYAVVRDAYEKGEAASLYEIQQKLSLMRFYSERLYQKPVAAKSKVLHDKEIKNRKGRKAENFFQNLNNQVRDELNTQKQFRDFDEYEFIDFQYFKFLVEQEKYLFEGTSSLREGDKNLLAATEQLDTFYLLLKLDHICQLLHYQRMSPLFEPDSAEHARFTANVYHSTQIVRLLREYGFLQQPEIAIYCIFLEFLTQDDPSEADRLSDEFEQLLEKNIQVLPKARVDSLQVILRSYWPARYRETKDKRYLEKIHDRQIRQIAQIQPEDLVPTMFFQNTLFSAFKLGKLEWANDFITQYSGRLKGLDEEQTSLLMEIVSAAAAFYQ
ncbi:MAG: hypothetical protein JNJ57_19765, partial [Saprospiraceae bacterium]|nr:hypothetical protein [Saprospiraceae bacterium]